jgi:cell division protein FtsI (penicillin-binding protein 3)
MSISKEIRLRVYISFLGMCLFGIMILAKGTMVYVKDGKILREQAAKKYLVEEEIEAERGNIYSEDGALLSCTIPQFDLRIDFKAINKDTFNKYLTPLSLELSKILNSKTATDWENELRSQFKKGARYYLLNKRTAYNDYLKIKKLQPFKKGKNKGGFIAEIKTKRINPYGMLANRVIGLYRAENAVGLEDSMNSYLSGRKGERVMRRLAGGAVMPVDGTEIEPENGKDIVTTLDMNIQDVAENSLLRQMEKEQAAFGSCIVMEVKTGKIKAMANLGRQEDGSYYEDKNYAITRLEPGSTYKLVSLASLMNDGKVRIEDKVNCEGGKKKFGKYFINDSHHGLGVLSVKDAMAQSSNVAFAKLIYNNYNENPDAYFSNLGMLGLNKKVGIEIHGESNPSLNRKSLEISPTTLAWMGMGYGVFVTPLHMCNVYNTVANNGVMMQPYLVNSIKEYGMEVKKFEPKVVHQNAIKKEVIEDLKTALHEVIETGTAKSLKNPYYEICGKTGTAQVADGAIKYSHRVYHGSFIGFLPKENPQYTICVVIRTRKGSSNYYGGIIALPVFKEVANRLYATNIRTKTTDIVQNANKIFPEVKTIEADKFNFLMQKLNLKKLNVPAGNWLELYNENNNWQYYVKGNNKNGVPNVKGMGLQDALYVLENAGLRVIVKGKGKVIQQSIEGGNEFQKGQLISILLS